MPLIAAGRHYGAMRILTPKIFPVADELPSIEQLIWLKGDNNLLDSSGKGHDAEWVGAGSPLYESNKFVARYYTSYGYLKVPSHDDFYLDPTGSFEIRFRLIVSYIPTTKQGSFSISKSSDATRVDADFYIHCNRTVFTDDIEIGFHTGSLHQVYPKVINPETEYTVKVTYEAGRFELYIDDILKTPTAYYDFSAMNNNRNSWVFAQSSYYGKLAYDDFMIYNGIN